MKKPTYAREFMLGALGAVAGLAAMRFYKRRLAPRVFETVEKIEPELLKPTGRLIDMSLVGKKYAEGEPSTMALGRIVFQKLTGHDPSLETKKQLGREVHYLFGLLNGGIYGVMTSNRTDIDLKGGVVFSILLWLWADELLVPLIGLQPGPGAVSPVHHVNRLTSHIFFGVFTALGTGTLRVAARLVTGTRST